jgi:DNA-binding NarL/FixJ family response regulator
VIKTKQVDLDGETYLVVEWTPATVGSLTPAERSVAELVARGATNQEIARVRRTSTRTIANQIASILRKLGVSSRVAIAAVIAKQP